MWLLRALVHFVLDFLQTIAISFALFVLVYLFLFQPHQVDGKSMEPNFHNGEYILTDKISYRFSPPKRGDVIVFHAPMDESVDYIKRIIGIPGDQVCLRNGYIAINGNSVQESYISSERTPEGHFLRADNCVSVSSGQFFVMGDNRPYSSDSREWGYVPQANIVGKAFFRYWPLNEFGVIRTNEAELTLGSVKGVIQGR